MQEPDIELEIEDSEEESGLFEHYRFITDPKQGLMRLDKFLNARIANSSRTKIQLGIENGFVTVNQKSTKANYQIKPGDEILVSLPHPPRNDELVSRDLPLHIVYEDDTLLVVNKAPGMVVHPAYGHWDDTLVNGLLFHINKTLPQGSEPVRPGLVHRIDKDTSGLLLIAKEEVAMMKLARQFFDHTVERTYWALVWGHPEPENGTINARLARSPRDRRVIEVTQNEEIGKHAITHYQVLERYAFSSLIKCNLETGRTHQIRAHMKSIGNPIFGDETYGGKSVVKGPSFSKYKTFVENCFELCPRQALHAKSLGFKHPATGKWIQFESELPDDMANVVEKWRKYQP